MATPIVSLMQRSIAEAWQTSGFAVLGLRRICLLYLIMWMLWSTDSLWTVETYMMGLGVAW